MSIKDLEKKYWETYEKYDNFFEKPCDEYNEKNGLEDVNDEGYKFSGNEYHTVDFSPIAYEGHEPENYEEKLNEHIKLFEDAIARNKPLKYEDLGFTKEEAEKIRRGEIVL